MEQLFEGERRLWAEFGVLEQHRVADDEVGRSKTHDLIQRVVPRLDAEQDAQRRVQHGGFTLRHRDGLGFEEARALLAVVVEDAGGERDFALGLAQQLAHFERDQAGKFISALEHQLGGAAHDRGPLRHRALAPLAVGLVGALDEGRNFGALQKGKVLTVSPV